MTIELYIRYSGTIHWYYNNDRHNNYGPAVEYLDGSKFWYINDNLHRVDGPAIEWPGGTKVWYVYGNRHRLDGPAVEQPTGNKEYWVNNNRYDNYLEYLVAIEQYNRLKYPNDNRIIHM